MTTTPQARLGDTAIIPLRTLDPAAALNDLEWLDDAIGDARVVAIGESAHYNRETYELRHRLLRYLVERHGFGAYAMETGFTEGRTPTPGSATGTTSTRTTSAGTTSAGTTSAGTTRGETPRDETPMARTIGSVASWRAA
ncbi:hypothetical protein ACFQ0B_30910 [Nonomuraea thailandensis]